MVDLTINVWQSYFPDTFNGYCLCCGEYIKYPNFHKGHIIADSKNGEYNIGNLLPLCMSCNIKMNNTDFFSFKNKYFPDVKVKIPIEKENELLKLENNILRKQMENIDTEPSGIVETPKPIVINSPITIRTEEEIYEKLGYNTILELGNEWEYYVNPKWCKIYKKIWKRKKNPPLFHYEFFKLNNKDNIVNVEFHIEGDIKYTSNNELKNKDIKYISKNRNIYKTTDIDLAPKEMSKFIKETYIYFDEVFNIIKTNKDNNRHKYIDLFINYLKEIDYKTNIDIRYECDLYLKVENLEKGIDLYIIIYKYKKIACVLHNVSNNLKQRLIEERENIKKEFGIDLTPRKERENIFETFLEGVDMTDISKFKEYQEWHIETLKILKNIFNKYSKENDT